METRVPVALGNIVAMITQALRAMAPQRADQPACKSCGAHVEAPLDECLDCLGERHW